LEVGLSGSVKKNWSERMKNRKEYDDRWNKPLINQPFTLDEYEKEKLKQPLRACKGCHCVLAPSEGDECFQCYQENFRKGTP